MRQAVLDRLLDLNRGFYQSFAGPFSESRGRLQPGVLRALAGLPSEATVLDLGCGNGRLAAELARRGHAGAYVGVDSSGELLDRARRQVEQADWRFVQAELAEESWVAPVLEALQSQRGGARPAANSAAGSSRPASMFERAFAFAVLHHLPGAALRARLLGEVRALLAPGGRLTLSVWNFLASPRLRKRIRPWREAGLEEAQVEAGDHLLDWRRGGQGLRYVHHFTEPELAGLAQAAGFRVVESYLSDGEGRVLGRYQVWEVDAW